MYDRLVIKINDSEELQKQLLANQSFRFVAAIPWGDDVYLIFERNFNEGWQ